MGEGRNGGKLGLSPPQSPAGTTRSGAGRKVFSVWVNLHPSRHMHINTPREAIVSQKITTSLKKAKPNLN